jgi:hypothetical protein
MEITHWWCPSFGHEGHPSHDQVSCRVTPVFDSTVVKSYDVNCLKSFQYFHFLRQMWLGEPRVLWLVYWREPLIYKTGVVYIYIRSRLASFPSIVKYSFMFFIIKLHNSSTCMKAQHRSGSVTTGVGFPKTSATSQIKTWDIVHSTPLSPLPQKSNRSPWVIRCDNRVFTDLKTHSNIRLTIPPPQ